MLRPIIFLLLVTLAACQRAPNPPDEQKLRMAIRRDIDSFNPYITTTTQGEMIALRLFPTLYHENSIGKDGMPLLEPYLVEKLEWSNGGETCLLTLKPNLVWSDGHPLTSDDLAYSFAIQKNPDVGWLSSDLKANISGWEVVNQLQIQIAFNSATPFNPLNLNEGFIIPKHHFESVPLAKWGEHDWSSKLVVYGPYRPGTYLPGESLTLEPLTDNSLPTLGFAVIKDKQTIYQLLLQGQLDYSWNLPVERIPDIHEKLNGVIYEDMSYGLIAWNAFDPRALGDNEQPSSPEHLKKLLEQSPHPLFSDVRVRQALTYAMDRTGYGKRFWNDAEVVPLSPWSIGEQGYRSQLSPRSQDREAAARLLTEAGWQLRDGLLHKGQLPFRFSIICNAGSDLREQYLLAIQQDLKAVGIQMDIELQEAGLYVANYMSRHFDAVFSILRRGSRPDLSDIMHSRAAINGGHNFSSWTHADSLLEAVPAITRPDQLPPLIHALEQRFYQDQPISLLFKGRRVGATSNPALKPSRQFQDPLYNVGAW